MTSDAELRINHEFVTAFESLRKRYGFREMNDLALHEIACDAGIEFTTLRTARHLRNALAHADPVNRQTLVEVYEKLAPGSSPARADPSPERRRAPSPPPARAFRLHAWRDADLEAQMLSNGFVSIGGEEIGDLSSVEDIDDIRDQLSTTMPERTRRAISRFAGYWRLFLWEAKAGDLAVLPLRDRTVTIGDFVGPYRHVAGATKNARHRRAVSWNARVSRDAFDADLLVTLNGRHTVQEFKAPDAAERLRVLAR